jgi:hypothetical protein
MWALKKQIGVSLVSPKENIAGGASLHFCSKLKRGGLLGISAKPSYRKHILENVIKEIIKHRKSLKSGDLDKQKFLSLPYRIRCLIPPQSNKLSDESSLPDFAGEHLIESLVFSDQSLERWLLRESNFIGEKYYEDIISSWPMTFPHH